VLAYDRLIRDADLDVYVTFDNERVGYLQAQGVLDKIREGNVILLGARRPTTTRSCCATASDGLSKNTSPGPEAESPFSRIPSWMIGTEMKRAGGRGIC